LTSAPSAATKQITVNLPASTQNTGLPLQIEWEIEFEAARFQTDFPVSATPTGPATLIFLRTGSDFELRSPSNAAWIVNTGLNLSDFNNFRIRSTFNGTTHTQQLFLNGSSTPFATRNPTTAAIGAQTALFALGSSTRAGGIKFFKYTDFVTPANSRMYDADASGGTGNILPETLNGFNGTQAGTWPANNDEWVFYSSGATYQLTALGGTFSYSGAQASLLRQFKLQTLGATYAYSGAPANLTYVPTGTVYTLTALGGSFAYSGGQASLLRRFRLIANGGAYSYAGGSANLTYNQLPGIYRLTALGATYTYTGGIATLTATGVTPMANAGAYVIQASVGGTQTINAKIGGKQTIQAMVAI